MIFKVKIQIQTWEVNEIFRSFALKITFHSFELFFLKINTVSSPKMTEKVKVSHFQILR
jgi:hypothetical protein